MMDGVEMEIFLSARAKNDKRLFPAEKNANAGIK
jgi:hypothetical protein